MGIKDFYKGSNIFITGGTGFMGKVLIEKLLRSCPEINTIYILIRKYKGKDIQTRVNEMLELPLFEGLRKGKPGFVEKKIIPVLGDISNLRLGLSYDDYRMLVEKVSVVFHVAATVRFDELFSDSIIKNVRGTREVMEMVKQMDKLKVFLHVSTTYCNCNRTYVNEQVYKSPISWQDSISIAENMDSVILSTCTKKLLGSFPNTYTFAKLLAEQIINDEATKINNNIPMVIFRPSIVISSMKEPVEGWTDNINGPIGLMVATGKGVALVTLCDKHQIPDFMPVDLSVKAMIVAAYRSGKQNTSDNKILVYNSSSVKKSVTNNQIIQHSVKYFMLHPFDEILWRPRIFTTKSKFNFYVRTIFQQVIPAIIIDFIMKTTGKPIKVNLVKLQRKIYIATMSLSTFTLQTWTFVNNNFLGLLKFIPDTEKEDFDFSFDEIDSGDVFRIALTGTQKYLFNSNPKKIKQATKKLKRLVWLDRILSTLFYILIAWIFYKLTFSFISN